MGRLLIPISMIHGSIIHKLCFTNTDSPSLNNGSCFGATSGDGGITGTPLQWVVKMKAMSGLLTPFLVLANVNVIACRYVFGYNKNHTRRKLHFSTDDYTRQQGSCGQHRAHLGPVGPRWAPCRPHEPRYPGRHYDITMTQQREGGADSNLSSYLIFHKSIKTKAKHDR